MRLLHALVASALLASLASVTCACGGAVLPSEYGGSVAETPGDSTSTLTTFYSSVKLDGSQCLPQPLSRDECRVLVVSSRCVGEEGLREAETSDQEGIAALAGSPVSPGTRVCELMQLSPGLCTTKRAPAWCYVAGGCELASTGDGPVCDHALCPGAGTGPLLTSLGPAFLACDR